VVLTADGRSYAFGLGRALGIGWGVGGTWFPEGFEGDPADETDGRMILADAGDRTQLVPTPIPGLVCSVPRAH
jgi:hypothetical protein